MRIQIPQSPAALKRQSYAGIKQLFKANE